MNAQLVTEPDFVLNQLIRTETCGYRVIELLGKGGNSSVFLVKAADGKHNGILFALKMLTRINDGDRVRRFQTESEFLETESHPALMKIVDRGIHTIGSGEKRREYPYIIADYLPKTLRDAMREGLFIVEKVSFTLQLLSALAYLADRDKKIVHRDIKPENIFIRGRSCILGDFGLLKEGGDIEQSVEFINEHSTGVRFPKYYPSPDLVEYCKKDSTGVITPKSDIFQLGLVLAELYSGKLPLKPREKAFDPVFVNPVDSIPGSQGRIIQANIERMLILNPEERPSANELFDAWEGVFNSVVASAKELEGRVFW